jgi:hypothetical protein
VLSVALHSIAAGQRFPATHMKTLADSPKAFAWFLAYLFVSSCCRSVIFNATISAAFNYC